MGPFQTVVGGLLALSALVLLPGLPGAAQALEAPVAVVVNGEPVAFDQPPVERVGRVFVPLRGVFERLGASVVYGGGQINATGGGHEISLQIGSPAATVDGRGETLDVAPFLDGDRTLVPLRFISQALGADVRFDGTSNTVYIAGARPPMPPRIAPRPLAPRPQPPRPPASSRLSLRNRNPAEATNSSHPAVSASFSQPVAPNSVRIQFDGRDMEQSAYVSAVRFEFTTPDLPVGPHTVRVWGRDAEGAPFDRSWSFTSGNDTVPNALEDLRPGAGDTVGADFVISGRTLPFSRVKVAVAASAGVLGGIFHVGTGAFEQTVEADLGGHFAARVHIPAVAGGGADVYVQSTAPSGATTTKRYSLKT